MIEFEWPYFFFLLPLPVLTWLISRKTKTKEVSALKTPFYQEWLTAQDVNVRIKKSRPWKFFVALLAWCLLITATARPSWIGEAIEIPISGRDLMMAVDLSGSMEVPDFRLNGDQVDRLTIVKEVAGKFIERRVGDRIGLILFGKRAYVQTPLTFDLTTVQNMLNESVIGLAGKETAIGDAIGLAVKRLRERPEQSRVLILLTDGANTAGEVAPEQAASLAAEAGLKIYTIGVGADKMEISSFFGSRTVNPSSDLDEATLTKIAELTGGKYFRARDTQGLEDVYTQLDELEPMRSDSEVFRPRKQIFFWFLTLASILYIGIFLSRVIAFLRVDNSHTAGRSNV
ncbi:MAG: VWA domain-containing protein [Gammaproteobacteria bacterium]|nr:VWA domain-containing protein [Gammaproteobacteria bacterium]